MNLSIDDNAKSVLCEHRLYAKCAGLTDSIDTEPMEIHASSGYAAHSVTPTVFHNLLVAFGIHKQHVNEPAHDSLGELL